MKNSDERLDHATLVKLSRPSMGRFLAGVGSDWLVILATYGIVAWADHWALWPLAAIIIGTRQHALGIMGHEGVHYFASRNRTVNDWVTGFTAMWPIGIGLDSYRSFHFEHHRHLGTDNDPEKRVKELDPAGFARPQRGVLLRDLSGLSLPLIVKIIAFLRPRTLRDGAGLALFWGGLYGGTWALDCLWIAGLWSLSLATGFWAMFRIRVWSEHTRSEGTHRFEPTLWEKLLCFPHHTYAHYEHHRFAQIPSWNLPALRRLLAQPPLMTPGQLWTRLKELDEKEQKREKVAQLVGRRKPPEPPGRRRG